MSATFDERVEAQTDDCVRRPRVERALAEAMRNPLVYVIAGAGYGKTRAVETFLKAQKEWIVYWMQISENDNIGAWYWEHATHVVAKRDPVFAEKLRDHGFPDTAVKHKRFSEWLAKFFQQAGYRLCIVFDDFHHITDRQVLDYHERSCNAMFQNTCIVIISRKEPDINVLPLFSKDRISVIGEDILRFTQEEIAAFFRHESVSFTHKNLPRIHAQTQGWALAVRLLSISLKRTPGDELHALSTMKQNVFKLMEREAFTCLSPKTQEALLKMALVPSLPVTFLKELIGGTVITDANAQAGTFVFYDSFAGLYRIHPLYLDFLRSKTHLLSDGEKNGVYRMAAEHCYTNCLHMDAMTYYAKLGDYEGILKILAGYPLALSKDKAEFFLSILEGLDPAGADGGNIILVILRVMFIPRMLLEARRYDEAEALSVAAIREAERAGGYYSDVLLFGCYVNLGYIKMRECVTSYRYDFPQYFQAAAEHYVKTPYDVVETGKLYTCADMQTYACLVGRNAQRRHLDEYLEAARQMVLYAPKILSGLYAGYDDLVACEIAFFKVEYDKCKHFAYQAVIKARERNQYSIESMALYYLVRLAMWDGDYNRVARTLAEIKDTLSHYWNGQVIYDLYEGYFLAWIGIPDRAASWLLDPECESSDSYVTDREVLVRAKCLMASNKYYEGIAALKQVRKDVREELLFTELSRCYGLAAAFLKIGDTAEAMRYFKEAWRLSFNGEFEAAFIEGGRKMRQLAEAALKQANPGIPATWLRAIALKASAHAKKVASIAAAYKKEHAIADEIKITKRESQILEDLCHGLSRAEIAASRHISINTVKSVIQTLYAKLGAENNVDAVRIALDRKIT